MVLELSDDLRSIDVNNDGRDDVVSTSSMGVGDSVTLRCALQCAAPMPPGSFATQNVAIFEGEGLASLGFFIQLADVNADGKPDLLGDSGQFLLVSIQQ